MSFFAQRYSRSGIAGRLSKRSLSRLPVDVAVDVYVQVDGRASLVLGLLLGVCLALGTAHAAETRVAVAANFTEAVKEIGVLFQQSTGHTVRFSFAATGMLYTQISQRAPFDVFLAADQARAQKAIDEGFAVAGSRFTYAKGKLVLYSLNENLIGGADALRSPQFNKLAIANPMIAPYGAAAIAVLRELGLYESLQSRFVKGNNIAQTYQFVGTGNAEVGFVALSQISRHNQGSRWIVPESMYPEIAQDAVLLKRGADNPAAMAFIEFLQGPTARAVIESFGYGVGVDQGNGEHDG